jgi:hypothetical protein
MYIKEGFSDVYDDSVAAAVEVVLVDLLVGH